MNQKSNQRKLHVKEKLSINLGKLFVVLSICVFLLFMFFEKGSMLHTRIPSASAMMKGMTSGVASAFFMDMIAQEANWFSKEHDDAIFSTEAIALSLSRFLLHVNPLDPKSLLASELPNQLYSEEMVKPDHPADIDGNLEPTPVNGDKEDDEEYEAALSAIHAQIDQIYEIVDNQHIVVSASEPQNTDHSTHLPVSLSQQKKVFIYHSHPRESFLPELENVTKPSEANDPNINVRLLGARMSEHLNDLGIGVINSDVDYVTTIENYDWNFSYKYSLQTVREAFAANPELEYFIDIHRDSQGRDITTTEIDGVSYAKVAFVIGQENPNWEKNDAFATQIHEQLEKNYPGLSRGILGKNGNNGHGEYNQSVSPNSILIEVGGVENTLEECYRTVEVLAEVIASIVMDAELVDSQQPVNKEVL